MGEIMVLLTLLDVHDRQRVQNLPRRGRRRRRWQKIKERRRSGKVTTIAHELYGPSNRLNVAAGGGIADGLGAASNANLRIALQALAFQLAWDVVMAHLVPGYMIQKAITLAEGFSTNPLVFMYFFDNKYFMQPGGQVHLWDHPEFAIKKAATWNPADEGFATFFARMHEQQKASKISRIGAQKAAAP
jgi:hypothetical protein